MNDRKGMQVLIQIVFVCLFVTACKSKKVQPPVPKTDPPTIVDVIIAKQQPVSNIVEANGTVVANEYLEIHPEVSGRLTYLNIIEGSFVSQGAVLARINDADLRAQVAKSKVQLDLAQKTVDRYKMLLDVSGINQSDYDVAVNQVNGYKADIAYTQALIDKTVIRAPFSGIIGLRQVSPGALVTPASTLATLQQVTQVKLDFTLPENYGNLIKKGDLVDVEIDAATQQRAKAKIIAIEPGANENTRNLKVRAGLIDSIANPGAFVKVIIDAGKGQMAIEIPTNCLIPNDKNNQVIIVKGGKAKFVDVVTGMRQSNAVEIVKGLAEGDSVVVSGVLFARPNSKVKVRGVKKLQELITGEAQNKTGGEAK